MLGEILFQKKPRPRDAGRGNDPTQVHPRLQSGRRRHPGTPRCRRRQPTGRGHVPRGERRTSASLARASRPASRASSATRQPRSRSSAAHASPMPLEPRKSPQDRGHWASAWYFWSSWSLPCCRCRSAGFDEAGALVEAPLGLVRKSTPGEPWQERRPGRGMSRRRMSLDSAISKDRVHMHPVPELQMRLPASQNRGLA